VVDPRVTISFLIYSAARDIILDMNGEKKREAQAEADEEDFLANVILSRTRKNPDFPKLLEAAVRRRELVASLAAKREELGLSQELVATRMGTSQPAIARLEAGEVDAKLSTLERFATALGVRIHWDLVGENGRGASASRGGVSRAAASARNSR
jgi:ribosome-binding protein aMBF1 (putative translation factor)